MKQNIVRVTQSPMNAVRWCIDLACGHEVWITQKKRPATETLRTINGEQFASRRQVDCPMCSSVIP